MARPVDHDAKPIGPLAFCRIRDGNRRTVRHLRPWTCTLSPIASVPYCRDGTCSSLEKTIPEYHEPFMRQHHSITVRVVRRLIPGVMACLIATGARAQVGSLGTGGIRGLVRDSGGLAIIGAQITFPGTALVAETDDSGRFELAKVRPGMLSLRFRRVGYQPDTVELLVLAGRTVPLEVTLSRLTVSLTPVVVTGRSELSGWRAGFYQRKDVGAGHFFTAEDIDKRNPSMMSDMFRMIPGVTVQPSMGIIRNQLRFRGHRGCAPLTWLDGSPLAAGEFDIDNLSPRSIEAFEVYTGTIVPPRFSASPGIGPRTCGAIVIWKASIDRGDRLSMSNSPNRKSTRLNSSHSQ